MEHDHSHSANKKSLMFSFIIITVFMVVEVIGGLITNSLALLADAGHMLSDSISLGVAFLAFTLGERSANYDKTYGYKRFEILAAVFNGVTLVLIAGYIFYEAYHRFVNPPEVASTGMLLIATIGLVVNLIVAWIMKKGDTEENLNLRAAFLRFRRPVRIRRCHCRSLTNYVLRLGLGRSISECSCVHTDFNQWFSSDEGIFSCADGRNAKECRYG